eukprot:CAMPEP_0168536658 /NCGR_PEP_ID=MMETSP0405-20121227/19725_1 /TAXON_ID=498012 /ORGANISM="Trichosphaerium sp, Strain Am-I-7 wt" /LENGTH=116 /DNA_ID=CAMNT_0008564795 /DNA_START=210 /DNA_END=557 /DNA_ORIENTATION=+
MVLVDASNTHSVPHEPEFLQAAKKHLNEKRDLSRENLFNVIQMDEIPKHLDPQKFFESTLKVRHSEADINVRHSEADINNHVNHSQYIKWFEDSILESRSPGGVFESDCFELKGRK